MKFTDIFIHKPVLAIVISLVLLVLGLRSVANLPVLQYPRTENAVITVTTVYYGADPDVVAGFITTPLEQAISQANGIDYLTSNSKNSISVITANLKLNFDTNAALTEINAKINSVLNQLPPEAQQPTLSVKIGATTDAMYIGFSSDVLSPNQITDYLTRAVQPKLQSVNGIQLAEILGGKNFALRAWLDPNKLAAYALTASDVSAALAKNDFLSGLGNSKGSMIQVNLTANTNLHSVDEFKQLIIKQENGVLIRLQDVATVSLGTDDYESSVSFDGNKAVYIGLQVAPNANLLDVIAKVREVFPSIQEQLPTGLAGKIVYDATEFVNSAISGVIHTLLEALLIVVFVVFVFLGSPREILIPIVTIPLSLIGTFAMMLWFDFSINLLTLLALVIAIGLVVDDAIIIVENVNRHLKHGTKPTAAALLAARELANPIIAMTVVLIAVYVPVGFQGGLTGALFTEFAFTLAGSVTMSAIIALTLSPMMCAKMLKNHDANEETWEQRIVHFIDSRFESISRVYSSLLHGSLTYLPVTLTFAVIILISSYFLYQSTNRELAPQEDQGIIMAMTTSAPNATLEQRLLYAEQVAKRFLNYSETAHIFQLDMPSQSITGMVLTPWQQRARDTHTLQALIQDDMNNIAGSRIAVFELPSLPGSSGMPIQFVITATDTVEKMQQVIEQFRQDAQKTGLFMFLDSDLKVDLPQARVNIDRDKVALLGLTMQDVGTALNAMLGGNYVNYFSMLGRSYKVIPQVAQMARLNVEQLLDYHIRTATGEVIALSSIASLTHEVVPQSLNHFQQLNAATISGVPLPGVTLGDALNSLKALADKTLPVDYALDYAGQSRQLMHESNAFMLTFLFALVIIFLALAAQFESFRDPFIILVSVPMSITGALIFVALGIGNASLNIYTEVGLVTLMGLVSKHGILIVEFANHSQQQGKSKREAVEMAASTRLRPVLMTTAAMVLGVLPLIFASGAGAAARFNMGLVIASGLAIGTLFTLFVVPAVYLVLGQNHQHETDK